MPGCLIVNADDWGRDQSTTDRTLECTALGTVSSVSAMVFMSDSARAADIARNSAIDTGLHLNFSEPFSAPSCPAALLEHQRKLKQCLGRYSLARILYYPGLARSFEFVVAAQFDEYRRLYGADPQRSMAIITSTCARMYCGMGCCPQAPLCVEISRSYRERRA